LIFPKESKPEKAKGNYLFEGDAEPKSRHKLETTGLLRLKILFQRFTPRNFL